MTTTIIQLSLKMLCSLKHLNMTQIFIMPDHHHKSHPVKTFSVTKHMNHDIVRHPASEHSCVSGNACSDPGALQSQCFIKSYSCIVLLLSVAILIETWVIWQASLHNTIVWITEPTWETWGEMSLSLSLSRDWDSKQAYQRLRILHSGWGTILSPSSFLLLSLFSLSHLFWHWNVGGCYGSRGQICPFSFLSNHI